MPCLISYLFLINFNSYGDMSGSYLSISLKKYHVKDCRKDFTTNCEKTNNSFDNLEVSNLNFTERHTADTPGFFTCQNIRFLFSLAEVSDLK